MTMKASLIIIIPAFNESVVIKGVIREIQSYKYTNIIVVDDGSPDSTFSISKQAGACVLRHAINRGKGAAIKTGIEAAKIMHADVVVTFDGDGQHDPKDISRLVKKISEGYDVVLGSRFLHHQEIPFVKRIGNTIANIITYFIYGIWVTDSQSGLRAYTKRAYKIIDTQNDRYEIESETLREIRRHHLKYTEIPMRVRYTAYSQQKDNRQHIWSAILTMMKLIFVS